MPDRRPRSNAPRSGSMSANDHDDPDLQPVESIYEALDQDDPALAFALARAALSAAADEADADPVLHFLAGVALLELDEPEQAVAVLNRAVEIDPDDAEVRATMAYALYRSCDFARAELEAQRALDSDPSSSDAHHALALVLERRGELEGAEECFSRAAALDPDRFPPPLRLNDDEFERHVLRAREKLAEEFRRHLDEVVVSVEPLPGDELLHDEDPPMDPELFGLFVGVQLTQRSTFSPGGELPPRILLFKRNLERWFPDPDELVRQIAVTLYHELGHYMGLEEAELEAIELD
jgi:predicted Zn-dependent protease with MMP-like domain